MPEQKKDWTDEQKLAIKDKSCDILVSAAAGSGKTAVLTERLIRKITDPDSPIDINRILVVTFTEDAANELKVRIRDALTDAMAAAPNNKNLRRQYMMLPSAKISTIHGFCLDLIRGNYELLGLSPKIRVSDEGQNSLLMQQVADTVIDSYYSSHSGYDDIDDFVEFADNFITLQDSSLTSKVIEIYKKLQSYPEGVDFLKNSAEGYDAGVDGTSPSNWTQALFEHTERLLTYYLQILEDALVEISNYKEVSDKYIPAFDSSIEGIKAVINAIATDSYLNVAEVINGIKFKNMGYLKDYIDDDVLTYYKNMRKEFSEQFGKLKKTYYLFSCEDLKSSAEKSKDYILKLHKLLSAFDRRFSYEKRRRSIIDFNDMERMAYSLLVREDGSYTPLASEIAERYDEVYIDEYQDVNALQDSIFKAITRSTNRFMVGDIKQSIYGFRGAEPKIFADYRTDDSVKLISLTHNFRSDKPVIKFSNEICGNLFRKLGKTVPYNDSDELYFANGSKEQQEPEIVVIEDSNVSEQDVDDQSDDVDDSIPNVEASYVAGRINALIKTGVSPSDIAILLRSAKSQAKQFEDALAQYGIESRNKEQKDLFENPEVVLLMCILNVIDNPSRDIFLAGALKSPIYNVTLSELAEIRAFSKDTSLYDALKLYTKEFSFKKGEFFLSKLEEYRKRADGPVDRLIWHVYCDSGLLAYATDNKLSPGGGKANLMKLYDKARSFESGTFKGLYNFIRYVNDILNSDTVITSPSSSEDSGIVQIMTIHKSKGLQFKYVFICGAAKRFNTMDENADIIIEKNAGVALKLSDESGLATVDTLYRKLVALNIRKKTLEEEIRVLYVALTRAKSKLIIVGTVNNAEKLNTLSRLKKYASTAGGFVYNRKTNYLSWILLSNNSIVPTVVNANDITFTSDDNASQVQDFTELDENEIQKLTAEFSRRFAFKYHAGKASAIPAKLSVSELYPTILDDYDDSEKIGDNKKARMRVPKFIDENDSKGAKIGTATHQFMQFCDFGKLISGGVENEIERLTQSGFLSSDIASLVNIYAIKRFLESDLFSSLQSARSVYRELRFNVHLNASEFTSDSTEALKNEHVLVQGIIDCLFETDDGKTVLLDYKTDFVPKEMSICDAETMLIDRHVSQLSYYAAACKSLIGKEVDKVVIYSFALGRSIEIPPAKLIIS